MNFITRPLLHLVSTLTSICPHQPYTRILNSPEYKHYAAECATWGAPASIKEFKKLKQWRAHNKAVRPIHITPEFIRTVSDKFDEAHPYLYGHYVVLTIYRLEWAAHVGLITRDQLDAFKHKWRSTCT